VGLRIRPPRSIVLSQCLALIGTESNMLKISAVALPCVLLLAQSPAIGDEPKPSASMEACNSTLPFDERMLCIQIQRAGGAPCTGSVEERLACLENKITRQTGEIVRLRLEVGRLTNPRMLHQLDERRLSSQ
jgi:hypothetical protein